MHLADVITPTTKQQIDNLNDSIRKLKYKIDNLNDNIRKLKYEIDNLNDNIRKLKYEIDNLNDNILIKIIKKLFYEILLCSFMSFMVQKNKIIVKMSKKILTFTQKIIPMLPITNNQ